MIKVSFYTIGCKLNFSETATISRLFEKKNFEKVNFNEKADIYVINTCSVTKNADKKSRNIIRKIVNKYPKSFVAVVGCYAQLKPEEISNLKGVDIVLGTNEKFNLIKYVKNLRKNKIPEIYSCETSEIKNFFSSYSLDERTRSFLKIQDGCNYKCTYCTIPMARGKSRNDSIKNIVKTAEEISKKGKKEIVLTGVNIGDFGRSTNENFLNLIKELDKIEKIERFRISSIEPNLLSDEIIDFVGISKKFVPHFHIPLQSGINRILKLMKRPYNVEFFENRIKKIKNIMPDAFIGVDVIVGFPSETEDDFQKSIALLKSLDISDLHIFSYSQRENTKAILMKDQILKKVINERSKILRKLAEEKKNFFYKKNEGKFKKVLFESRNIENKIIGFTDNYLKVATKFDENLINKIFKLKIENLYGQIFLLK